MKKLFIFIGIFVVLLSSFSLMFVGCNKDDDNDEPAVVVTWKDNMKDLKSFQSETVMKDNGVVVHKYVKKVEYTTGDNATITTETSKLNSSFELDTTYAKEDKEIKREYALAVRLDEALYETYNESSTMIMGTVSNTYINSVLNTTGLEITGVATIVFNMTDNKLMSIVCTYKTTSNLDVTTTVAYVY